MKYHTLNSLYEEGEKLGRRRDASNSFINLFVIFFLLTLGNIISVDHLWRTINRIGDFTHVFFSQEIKKIKIRNIILSDMKIFS